MPIYFYEAQWGTSQRITGAKVTNVGELDLSSVQVTS
jgi:hypothetical protein